MRNKGFTLIELLLVLAIIGVLTSFLLANLIGAKARARDAQRKSDLRQIQAAMEMYRADKGNYPTNAEMTCSQTLQDAATGAVYMQKIPCDPLNTAQSYSYNRTSLSTYDFVACLENGNDSQRDPGRSAACPNTFPASLTLHNP